MNPRRLGRFIWYRGRSSELDFDEMAQVFRILNLIPVRAEHMFEYDGIEYTAVSERFEVVPNGQKIPEYTLEITGSKAGNVERVKVNLR